MPRIFARTPVLVQTIRSAAGAIAYNQFIGFDDKPAGADAPVQGVADADAAIGEAVPSISIGYVEMKAAVAIAKGDRIYSDANGQPTNVGANNHVGRASKAAANPGEIVGFLLNLR